MSIKKTTVSEQNYAISVLQARIDNLLGEKEFKNLPKEVKQQVKDFTKGLQKSVISDSTSKFKEINGEVLDARKILDLIIDASGDTKWVWEDTEHLEKSEIKDIKEKFGVSFDVDEILKYRFYRSTDYRNDVNMITVTALPSYNYVEIDTDRAGIQLDDLVTAAEMKKALVSNF